MQPPPPHSLEEDLDFIIDKMRNSDATRIRRQFQSYNTPTDELNPGDNVYATGNSWKLQIQ